MTRTHITAPNNELHWRYSVPDASGQKMLLLTIGRIATIGSWSGSYGQYFIAWCPLPRRDKAKEAELKLI